MKRRVPVGVTACWTVAGVMAAGAAAGAHSGPPFPIVSNRTVGAYVVSLWADPDASDDGSAAGRFWVMLDPAHRGASLPPDTRVTVQIWPVGRQGSVRMANADPVARDVSRQFVALVMDHEGHYAARVTIQGPLGPAEVETEVDLLLRGGGSPVAGKVLGVSLDNGKVRLQVADAQVALENVTDILDPSLISKP